MKQLQPVFLILLMMFGAANLLAQKTQAQYYNYPKKKGNFIRDTSKPVQNGLLNSADYKNYGCYEPQTFIPDMDLIKSLITIDWLISKNQTGLLRNNDLGFNFTFRRNPYKKPSVNAIDTIAISGASLGIRYPQGDTLYHKIINDYKLKNLKRAFVTAKVIIMYPALIEEYSQVDVILGIKMDAANSGEDYDQALLDYIKNLLKQNEQALGLSDDDCSGDTIYIKSYEPAGLSVDDQISCREKFIRYVHSIL